MSQEEDKSDIEYAIRHSQKYLEDLLSFFGLNVSVHATADEDVIELDVPSTHLNGFLIGQRGDTLRAVQFIVSNALKNGGYQYSRVNVDIAGYKKALAARLEKKAEDWVGQVKQTGQPMDLSPMNAADRRTIHKFASEAGVSTESVGEGRDRHIVLKPLAPDDTFQEDVTTQEPTKAKTSSPVESEPKTKTTSEDLETPDAPKN